MENKMPNPADMQAMAGVKVLELGTTIAGPFCARLLADFGAEVIKVEPLDGDHTRKLTASGAGFFPTYNRNKKSIAVDLKSAEGRELVLKLIASAALWVAPSGSLSEMPLLALPKTTGRLSVLPMTTA